MPTPTGVVDIAGDSLTHCAVLSTGRVMCWGWGEQGQLGDGIASAGHASSEPVEVAGLDDAVAVAVSASMSHVCAVRKNGAVACWGRNEGTLGFDSPQCGPYPRQISDTEFVDDFFPCETKPRDIPGVSGAATIAIGTSYQCAVSADGVATCWGAFGTIDGGLQMPVQPPAPLKAMGAVKQISVGFDHSCALLEDARVACWGDNKYGQLGLGPGSGVEASPDPLLVPGIDKAVSLTASSGLTCTPRASGKITCWGAVTSIVRRVEDFDGQRSSGSWPASQRLMSTRGARSRSVLS
ncbi:MAG: hypothetical protein U0359_32200 [Byssovorax sp.]